MIRKNDVQFFDTEQLKVRVTIDLNVERTGNFIDELESLLEKFAEPSHKYLINMSDQTTILKKL